MRKQAGAAILLIFAGSLLSGCADNRQNTEPLMQTTEPESEADTWYEAVTEIQESEDDAWGETGITASAETALESPWEQNFGENEILNFVDVFGEEYEVAINPNVEKHEYDLNAFLHMGDYMEYSGDERYTYRLGVDVSHHQGMIDWERVKNAGYEFAFLRIGYRGYGNAGNVCLDKQFFENIRNAQKVGIDVGVYFFSQAVNEEEAREEAEFVLKNLEGYELQLPVVYDPENILDAEARTDDVTGEQFTRNTVVFCEMIRDAGYDPMIYSNMLWEAYQYDLEQLKEYPIWYADYEKLPQTPYHFEFWQYTNTARIDGIEGVVDLNIQLVPIE